MKRAPLSGPVRTVRSGTPLKCAESRAECDLGRAGQLEQDDALEHEDQQHALDCGRGLGELRIRLVDREHRVERLALDPRHEHEQIDALTREVQVAVLARAHDHRIVGRR